MQEKQKPFGSPKKVKRLPNGFVWSKLVVNKTWELPDISLYKKIILKDSFFQKMCEAEIRQQKNKEEMEQGRLLLFKNKEEPFFNQ